MKSLEIEINTHADLINKIAEKDCIKNRFIENTEESIWYDAMPTNRANSLSANKTIPWLSYENRKTINPDYKDTIISYALDDKGFRLYPNYTPTSDKLLHCYGCSYTFGFSVPDEDSWPLLLAQKLGNWKVKNYGMPGEGAWAIARSCYQVISSLKKENYPDVVYIMFPEPHREECIGNREYAASCYPLVYNNKEVPTLNDLKSILNVNEKDIHTSRDQKKIFYYDYVSLIYCFFETVTAYKFIEEFLASKNIQWYWYSWSWIYPKLDKNIITEFLGNNTILDEFGVKNILKKTKGRDMTHVGRNYYVEIADNFAKLYELSKKSI